MGLDLPGILLTTYDRNTPHAFDVMVMDAPKVAVRLASTALRQL